MQNTEQLILQFRENLEIVKQSYQAYQEKLEGKSCYLGLANGRNLFLKFYNPIVAHLVGVQYSYLRDHPLFIGKSSFDCLMILFEETDLVEDEIRRGNLDIFFMFSPYIQKKSLSLQKIPPLDRNFLQEIVFVCSYEKNIMQNKIDNSLLETDYIVGIRSSDNDMNLLGVIEETAEEEKHFFTINSNLIIENDENYFEGLENIIGHQTLTYPTHMNLYNCNDISQNKLYFLNNEDKLNKINNLEYYVEKLKIKIDALGEAKKQLMEVTKYKNYCSQNEAFYRLLLDCFEKKDVTNMNDLNLIPAQVEVLHLVKDCIRRCDNAEFTIRKIMGDLNEYSREKDSRSLGFYKK